MQSREFASFAIADARCSQRPLYAVGWDSYSSDGPGRPFADCASRTTTSQDVCKVGAGFVVTIPAMGKK